MLSPTYNLYFTYSGPQRNLLHLDAYRLNSDTEAEALLIEDFLEPPWCLAIEWPKKVPSLIDRQAWWLSIECTGEFTRGINFASQGQIKVIQIGKRLEWIAGAIGVAIFLNLDKKIWTRICGSLHLPVLIFLPFAKVGWIENCSGAMVLRS